MVASWMAVRGTQSRWWRRLRSKKKSGRWRFEGCLFPFLWCLGWISVRDKLRVGYRGFGFFAFFLSIDGKQHVMIEAVLAVIAMPPEVQIDFGTLGKPKLYILLRKRHRTIFDNGMFASQPDLR